MSNLKNKSDKDFLHERSWVREFVRFLENKLAGPLPGLKAQLGMITHPRPGNQVYHEVEGSAHKAGVLVLFYPWRGRFHLVLTCRTDKVDYHKRQISFPGGRQEKGETLEQTAKREAQEELDIDPNSFRILGRLTPLYIPPSNTCIYPVVAVSESRPDFRPNRLEVAEVLEIPINLFLNLSSIQREKCVIKGTQVEVPFYAFREHKIWGATAMVLAELIEIIKRASPNNEQKT